MGEKTGIDLNTFLRGRAALEAAAPPSTAQAQQEFSHDLFAAIHRTNYPGCGDCENFPTTRDVEMFDAIHKVLKRYALATPSPQAPPPANLPAGDIAWGIAEEFSAGPLLYGEKGVLAYRIAKAIHTDRLAQLAAATQEQPAGSGARRCERCSEIVPCFWIDTHFAGEREPLCAKCISIERGQFGDEIEKLKQELESRAGSPRKVGEDALKVGDKVFVRGEVEYIDESSDGVWMGVKVSGHATTMEFEPNELARSSSVPVGEQRPKVVCLCGSTRFYEMFQKANYDETMLGNIVLSVGFYPHAQKEMHHEEAGCTPEQKIGLDELHKRKIDLADEVFVLNVGGYIGSSTRGEIDYAVAHSKPVRFLEALGEQKQEEGV